MGLGKIIYTDVVKIKSLSLTELWTNYMRSMDSAMAAAREGNRDEAYFFVAVVKVTLDAYFDEVERVLETAE